MHINQVEAWASEKRTELAYPQSSPVLDSLSPVGFGSPGTPMSEQARRAKLRAERRKNVTAPSQHVEEDEEAELLTLTLTLILNLNLHVTLTQ